MVFDGGDFDENRNYAAARIAAFRAASCVKILGKGVIRVVHRVDDARENNNLGKTIDLVFLYNWLNFLSAIICRKMATFIVKCRILYAHRIASYCAFLFKICNLGDDIVRQLATMHMGSQKV
jgi:hypothetical protein